MAETAETKPAAQDNPAKLSVDQVIVSEKLRALIGIATGMV